MLIVRQIFDRDGPPRCYSHLAYSLGVSYSLYPLPPRVSNSHKHCPLSVTKCGRPTEFSLGPVYISGHIRPASGLRPARVVGAEVARVGAGTADLGSGCGVSRDACVLLTRCRLS